MESDKINNRALRTTNRLTALDAGCVRELGERDALGQRLGPACPLHDALAERGDTGAHHTAYRAVLMPALHRLRFCADCRIFQAKSVPEIVEAVLKETAVTAFRFALTEPHAPREYCVQYRETHLAFLERLLAEEGIAYHFAHEAGAHTLVLTDATRLAPDAPGAEAIEYNALCEAMNSRSGRK